SRARSDARRYPAIDPLESWSKYTSIIEKDRMENLRAILRASNDVAQMMKVVGEEGTSIDDFIVYLKGEFLDAVYLQQNAFNETDAATPAERQIEMFGVAEQAMTASYAFDDKAAARKFFQQLSQTFIDWNMTAQDAPEYASRKEALVKTIEENSHV
ncbi:MAG: V-type ATP synthase subunit A, partial [Kiritimatiellae bacterium]|nr:V-type ATP synthase subunit A [Kiritimatiellia bacterium]